MSSFIKRYISSNDDIAISLRINEKKELTLKYQYKHLKPFMVEYKSSNNHFCQPILSIMKTISEYNAIPSKRQVQLYLWIDKQIQTYKSLNL